MTSTVLRVKRRLEDNPQDALVLVCKRKRTDVDEVSPSLFVFRGSVNNQETGNLKDIVPSTIKKPGTSNVTEIISKIRKEKRQKSAENRYKIVTCSRGLKEENADAENIFDLVDLERKYDDDVDEKYIYDLYTSAKEDFDISMLDDLVCIENYETDLIFGSYRDNGLEPSDEEDDEDSNAENDYRNEYPDTDNSSINEEDMIRAMERVDLDELSSDTGEDKIYDEPPDLFNEDVKRYGEAYAKYKARVMKEQPDLVDTKGLVHCAKIKELDGGYKDDSDDGFYYGQEEDTEHYREQYKHSLSDEYETD
ncbi:probable RNA polymerase II nuclear localization protein SLC7A6OS [Aricia agestis]|uniref:probable RNA polymerase II nuclear localization protein SLC7A6OS n=1 Tax=Aricia agestis TaxID=91739 RepID=UPI001C2048A4|nr:probable RNA polymerase II nuclear localization protein SLC7A6OS [Aricia agestis]